MARQSIAGRRRRAPSCACLPWCVLGLALLLAACAQHLAGQAGAEDKEAFREARATVDPEERLKALRSFAAAYPDSALRPRATALALETLLQNFPARTGEVHELASQEIADAPSGLERTLEQARVADALASAEPAGADLREARGWAETALAALNEESFRRETAAAQRRYKLPPLTPREVHHSFERDRVLCLTALAHVNLQDGKPAAAEPLLNEAFRLDPLASEVNALQGQLAMSRHQDSAALEAFERAEATGALPLWQHAQALQLYAATGGGGGKAGFETQGNAGSETQSEASFQAQSEAGFQAQIDALYTRLMPPVFALPPRTLPPGGHTALLELFTGSGCEPCVAPDLAVESLLATYGRQDLAVLEYDENIPRPDPLTSPASESRALLYRVGSTPEAFLDGVSLPVAGSTRGEAENVVVGFASELEDEAAQPSPLRLTLEGTELAGAITVHAAVTLAPGATVTALPARPVIHVALVQDGIRYSGENGVRFHRMVVRAMGPDTPLRLATGAAPVPSQIPTPSQTLDARFDLKAVAGTLRSYLDAYEHGNDRFGQVRFRTKDLPLVPAQMGVVVWVQDAVTRRVLQAASLALPETR